MRRARKHLLQDVFLLAISIALAVYIVRLDVVSTLLAYTGDGVLFVSFIAGAFFTSLFTAAPAMVVLGSLMLEHNLMLVTLVASLGAVVGDYLLFLFVRKRLSADAEYLSRGPRLARVAHAFRRRHLHRLLPLVGVLFLITPLPDELALALLGLSDMRPRWFIVLSFASHFVGILAIGLVARSLT